MEGAVPSFYDQLAQWSEIVGGFAFVIVAFLLFQKYLLPAVQSAQVASNADLVKAEARLEALRGEVVTARAGLEAADRDAAAIKERAAADAERERDRLLSEATADGERTVSNAENELDRARAAARAQLRTEFIDRALALARTKAASRIDASVNARLVGHTVQTLLGDAPAGGGA
jgi:F0F1-type ATP synthase membrane subunit b/b'